MSNELAALAGGDETDLEVEIIRSNVAAAWERLEQQHPCFFQEEQ